MIKYCCDMCGKASENEHDVVTIRLPVPDDELPFEDNIQDFMLCGQCATNVSAFIKGQALAMQGNGDGR